MAGGSDVCHRSFWPVIGPTTTQTHLCNIQGLGVSHEKQKTIASLLLSTLPALFTTALELGMLQSGTAVQHFNYNENQESESLDREMSYKHREHDALMM